MVPENREGQGGQKREEMQYSLKSLPEGKFIDIREGKGETEIIQLPPTCTLTGGQTHNLLVSGTTLQPTEPPSQSEIWYIIECSHRCGQGAL